MEWFVQLIVIGGLVLVGALWIVALFEAGSMPWIGGLILAVLGVGGVMAGIVIELEADAFRTT
ncbi:hypothetical protein RBH26_11140 [Natronolimnohabitans sp. A-GB9]|uniref:hypothetical protein n=1 Tax=Natronolimnohabitans sp. A-GB9 TaxID=3069757 RepID=UPI0027B379B5|nr:hypothetical protein [Natronolimnohabitans sp. A-GB9]MDQ2051035.1 hypothetical protein [Natronolimnohabitans sp. A-GB9]